jgi:hypothetical protein
MLLQLTYMIVPFRRWDWARYLGCAALTALIFVSLKRDHPVISAGDGLVLCGAFTFAFALAFQNRLLPRLNEGVVLIWTTVLICVTVELNAWHSAKTYLVLCAGLPACALVIVRHKLPYALKIALYAWFLIAVVAMGVLQFRGSDLSLIANGGSDRLDYGFALIDGAAAAYIGVHVVFLYEILPIPAKGERWSEFQARWTEYLNEIVARLDDLHLERCRSCSALRSSLTRITSLV